MKYKNAWGQLIESTIQIGAREGIEKLTTRKIAVAAGLPDTYIYRFCKDKKELIQETFMEIGSRIGKALDYAASRMDPETAHVDYIVRILWCSYWNYLVEHEEELRFFLNFHHSGYFTKQMAQRWSENYMTFGRLMAEMLKLYHISSFSSAPVLIAHIEMGTLDMAIAYQRGVVPQTKENVEAIYRVIMKALLDDLHAEMERSGPT